MPATIRLTRLGKKKRPFYRLVVLDSRTRRDGAYLANLGYYNPFVEPAEVELRTDDIIEWLDKGAQLSQTARSLLRREGVLYHYSLVNQGLDAAEIEQRLASWREGARARVERIEADRRRHHEQLEAEERKRREDAAKAQEAAEQPAAEPAEAKEPEAKEPEAKEPEAKEPETKKPETKAPEADQAAAEPADAGADEAVAAEAATEEPNAAEAAEGADAAGEGEAAGDEEGDTKKGDDA